MSFKDIRVMVLGCTAISMPSIAGCGTEAEARDGISRRTNLVTASGDEFETLPNLPHNACNDSRLPRSYGTNFPTPRDRFALGWSGQSAIGWQGNWYPAFAYPSGAYFARGVPTTFTQGHRMYCGAMYSFSIFTFGLRAGQAPPPQSTQWSMDSGYLPALRTAFTRGNVAISITNFANRTSMGGHPFVLAYTRVAVTNDGPATVTVPPGGSGPGLVRLTEAGDNVPPGETRNHDFVAAIDRFGADVAYPSAAMLAEAAPSYDQAYTQMASFWNDRVSATAQPQLPNLSLPNTGLANPGTALANAYRASTVYRSMMQTGKAPFSGADNHAWLLNHDVPGQLVARFAIGDFSDARNLLLTGRSSEQPGFPSAGANWYWDGLWKTPWAWAVYLSKTDDTAFVRRFFDDSETQFGPSLRTIMRTHFVAQLDSDGTLLPNFDSGSAGKWILSNYSALVGLAAYKYIATRVGRPAEAQWAQQAYVSLHDALNRVIGNNQATNGFDHLPCEVHQPNSANRCNIFHDANWAQAGWPGQSQWDTMLMGGTPLTGSIGDPDQLDRMYISGFSRLAGRVSYPSFGAFPGYSTAYNTAYSEGALYGTMFRDLALTSYVWQIHNSTGANHVWAKNHTEPQFGPAPYGLSIAGQQLALIRAIAAEGLAADETGPFTFTRPLYIGRGIPNAWIVPGQTIALSNVTSSYDVDTRVRKTYEVSLATRRPSAGRVITVGLSGALPGGPVFLQLPVFVASTVVDVAGGSYDGSTRTVIANPGATQVMITLND